MKPRTILHASLLGNSRSRRRYRCGHVRAKRPLTLLTEFEVTLSPNA